ncbi:MAG: hypothetical protein KC425_10750, partial [Anaerolineales bacterium]|nr:hypothetical protein [Anaerolineales bacterium]
VRQGAISERDTRSLKGLKPSQQRALVRALEAGDVNKNEYKQVARYLKNDAPNATVHEAIRVLHMPLPPAAMPDESEFDASLAELTAVPSSETLDAPSAISNSSAPIAGTRVTNVLRLHWVRGHLARVSAQNAAPAERQEMRRLLQLIQQDVASLLAALGEKS